jgi:hypothetical protein
LSSLAALDGHSIVTVNYDIVKTLPGFSGGTSADKQPVDGKQGHQTTAKTKPWTQTLSTHPRKKKTPRRNEQGKCCTEAAGR